MGDRGSASLVRCEAPPPGLTGLILRPGKKDWHAHARANAAYDASCREAMGAAYAGLTSWQVAHDLEALRAALGEPKLRYFGNSYGTVYGQAYLESFPTKVGRMVLDGVADHTRASLERWLLDNALTEERRARPLPRLVCERVRARIARDVHDVVGHHLSAIRLQAVMVYRAGTSWWTRRGGGRRSARDARAGGAARWHAHCRATRPARLAGDRPSAPGQGPRSGKVPRRGRPPYGCRTPCPGSRGRPSRRRGTVSIRVIVADDQAPTREGLRLLLSSEPDMEVVTAASDGFEVVEMARRHRPDVVLADLRMPRVDGLSAIRDLTSLGPAPAVVALTTFDLDEYLFGALQAGAVGFLLKERSRSDPGRGAGRPRRAGVGGSAGDTSPAAPPSRSPLRVRPPANRPC